MSAADLSDISRVLVKMEQVKDINVFSPAVEHRRAKSTFWSYFATSDELPPEDISLSIALKYSADRRVSQWWDLPGFQDWFSNKDEFRQRMEYLSNLALDRLEAILVDSKGQAASQVAAAKLIMEVSRKMPSKASEEQFVDEKIHLMDKKQLEEYISRGMRLLPSPEIVDAVIIPE